MDKLTVIWVVIGVYAVMMLAVGILQSRKNAGGMESFTVGGRSAGAWISALSYGTAYFSAVMFIGYSGGSGWSFGLWSVLVGVGNAVFGTLLAWLVLAERTRVLTRRWQIKSMPQLFEMRFKSPGMRLFSCIVIFVFLIPYSASVYKGLTSVCSVILGVDEQICMIIIAIASAVVLILGGYMATLKADFVQGFIMMVGVAALIVLVVLSPQVGGLWLHDAERPALRLPCDGALVPAVLCGEQNSRRDAARRRRAQRRVLRAAGGRGGMNPGRSRAEKQRKRALKALFLRVRGVSSPFRGRAAAAR